MSNCRRADRWGHMYSSSICTSMLAQDDVFELLGHISCQLKCAISDQCKDHNFDATGVHTNEGGMGKCQTLLANNMPF